MVHPTPTNDAPRLLTTIWDGNAAAWFEGAELLDRRTMSWPRYIYEFVKHARHCDAAVVLGSLGAADGYCDVVAGIALKVLPARRRPVLVVMDATWEQTSAALAERLKSTRLAGFVARAFIRAIDGPHVVYCVLSEQERATFADHWDVDDGRVVLTHFPLTRSEDDLDRPTSVGDFLFAGGDPLRDYDLLLDATEGLDLDVRIASRRFSAPARPRLEVGPVSHAEFLDLEAAARVVVVPLRSDTVRSAGQQTYLNVLALGKPLIVTEAPGVRDYLIPDVHALLVPPEPEALRAAIEYVLDPANADEVDAMAARGKAWVREQFTDANYRDRTREIAEAAVAQRHVGAIDLAT